MNNYSIFEPTPKPTEYRHVKFRSKSEAVLAKTFDKLHLPWEYEPARFAIGDWKVDFAFNEFIDGQRFCSLAEYKPSALNNTYRQWLGGQFEILWARNCGVFPSYVFSINPYSTHEQPAVMSYLGNGNWRSRPDMSQTFSWYMRKHARDRFDLEDPRQLKFRFASLLQRQFLF